MNIFQKCLSIIVSNTRKIITLILSVFLLTTCEEPELRTPSQGNLDPESWAPVYPEIEVVDVLSRKLSWQFLGDDRIDGFKIDRQEGDNPWTEGYITLEREEREWIDSNFAFDTTIMHSYRIYAFAGAYQSEARVLSFKPEFPAPENFTVEKESDISFRLEWEKTDFGEQGYIIDRKTGSNDWETAIATLEADQLFFIDTNAVHPKSTNIPIQYRLTAFFEDARSIPVYGTDDVTLQAPYNTDITVISNTELELFWSFDQGWHHGFKIDRRVENGPWSVAYAMVDKNSRSYIDGNINLGSNRYTYKIYSYFDDYESGKISSLTVGRPEMLTGNVSGIAGGLATFHGNILHNGGIPYTRKGFVYGLSPNPTIEDIVAEVEGTEPFFNIMVSGLETLTTYYVRSFIVNPIGIIYGNEVSFLSAVADGMAGTVTDIEGNIYQTITIAGKWWMAENLKTTMFSNGDMISEEWSPLQPAYAWYNNDSSNKDKYGALYNWYAVDDVRGLCPSGWRVPADSDWLSLIEHLHWEYGVTNDPNFTNSAGNALKSCRQVNSPLGGECATVEHPVWNWSPAQYGRDIVGFSGLPGGFRNSGDFIDLGLTGYWWVSDNISTISANAWHLGFNNSTVYSLTISKEFGFSVRCIKDYEP